MGAGFCHVYDGSKYDINAFDKCSILGVVGRLFTVAANNHVRFHA